MLFFFTKEVFRIFGERIKNRFDLKGKDFSEDYMRYVFFTSLLEAREEEKDSLLVHMDLEFPYEKLLANNELAGKKLDMWVSNASPEIAIECKYHRVFKNAALGLPMNAGSIFEDLRRLSEIKRGYQKDVACYLVYVTTETMAAFFYKNYENFFELKEGDSSKITKKFILSEVPIFKKQINKKGDAKAFECTITNVFADESGKEESKIYIRIFEVDI